MKRSLTFALSLSLLILSVGCGKDNKSGKKNDPWGWSGTSLYQPGMPTPGYGNFSVSSVINETPCAGQVGNQQRVQIQVQLTSFPTRIPANDIYVGVTSFGDVATLVGTGGVPTFIAYVCMRSQASGQGQLFGISLLPYSRCQFKQMNATMQFADGTYALFRMMDAGNSVGQPFSSCM